MLNIKCPYCGDRSQKEFAYGGDGTITRPKLNQEISDEEWDKVATDSEKKALAQVVNGVASLTSTHWALKIFNAMKVKERNVTFRIPKSMMKDLRKIKIDPRIAFKKWGKKYFHIADPAHGAMKLKVSDFKKSWCSNAGDEGIVLLLEPSPNFYTTIIDDDTPPKKGFRFLYGYLRGYNAYITQVFIGLFGVSILQLIFPFLTQGIVDRGIHYRDVNFVLIILISQLMLLAGQFTIEFIRNWIMLHMY